MVFSSRIVMGGLTMRDRQLCIRELPLTERPRNRLSDVGPFALSDAELLAALIGPERVDDMHRLLSEVGGLRGLFGVDTLKLRSLGVSPVKAAQLVSSVELGRRMLLAEVQERFQVRCPSDLASLLMLEMSGLDQEQLRAVLLDTKNRVQSIATIYIGSLNSSLIRVGEVFKDALRRNSAAIIVVHNHPSGDPTPSPEDVLVTREIVQAGTLLDVQVLDHLVIGQGRFVSMRERGLGFAH
jgi:DNA repair protein RadC